MNANVKQYFDNISDSYDISGSWITDRNVLEIMLALLQEPQNKKIVDLGSGTGAVINYLQSNISKSNQFFAFDLSQSMLEKNTNLNIQKIVGDLCATGFGNETFDVAITRQCLHYIADIKIVLSEIRRIVKTNGQFIFAQIVPYDTSTQYYWSELSKIRQPLRKQFCSENEWIELIENSGFQMIKKERCFSITSLNDWIEGKKIQNPLKAKKYRDMLLKAPIDYKNKYSIIEQNGDVFFNSYWIIASFNTL